MTTSNQPIERPNFASTSDTLMSSDKHVFTGEQRIEAKKALFSMLTRGKFAGVLQIIQKDPSLSLETIPWHSESFSFACNSRELDFPFLCLETGCQDGYVFAIQHGYPVNKSLYTGDTLLNLAIYKYFLNDTNDSDIELLLSLGADPNINSPSSFAQVMNRSFSRSWGPKMPKPNFRMLNAMLDAHVNLKYCDSFLCPLSYVVQSTAWMNVSIHPQLTQLMARLVKEGCDVGAKSGSEQLTPLERSIEMIAPIQAIVALVRLGADPKVRQPWSKKAVRDDVNENSLSLLDVMARYPELRDHIPLVQSAIMERTIATSLSSSMPAQASDENPKPENQSRRRRMGGV
jgi:hypothetical protein